MTTEVVALGAPSVPAKTPFSAWVSSQLQEETGWKIPEAWVCQKHIEEITAGIDVVSARMAPTPQETIRQFLGRMAVLCRARDEGKAVWSMRAAEYHRLLGEYPEDIWAEAVDAHLRDCPFFPTIADLEKHMAPLMQARRRDINRLMRMHSVAARSAKRAPRHDLRPLTPEQEKLMLERVDQFCRAFGR
jgi:hypothetical protein